MTRLIDNLVPESEMRRSPRLNKSKTKSVTSPPASNNRYSLRSKRSLEEAFGGGEEVRSITPPPNNEDDVQEQQVTSINTCMKKGEVMQRYLKEMF